MRKSVCFCLLVALASLNACVSKEEGTALNQIISLLDNKNVLLKKGLSTKSGKYYEIEIRDLKYNPQYQESQLEGATSISALLLHQNLTNNAQVNYQTIIVSIKNKNIEFKKNYKKNDLLRVEKAWNSVEGLLTAFKDKDRKLLKEVMDKKAIGTVNVDSLIALLHKIDNEYGIVKGVAVRGFKLNGMNQVQFWAHLKRPNEVNQRVDLTIENNTMKVVEFDF